MICWIFFERKSKKKEDGDEGEMRLGLVDERALNGPGATLLSIRESQAAVADSKRFVFLSQAGGF